MNIKKLNWANIATIAATLCTIISFAASLDKRETVNENHLTEIEQRVDTIRADLNTINNYQDQQLSQFREEINSDVTEMNGRIEKIYGVLFNEKKHGIA